jgi:TolB-like protein
MSPAASPIRRLLRELRRRRLFRTAALYVVGTWLVLQVADVIFPALEIPEQAIRYLLVAALLGFPAALVFSWFYDVGVDGIRRTGAAQAGELDAAQPLRRSDYFILTALAGVVAAILYGTAGKVIDSPTEIQETRSEGPPMVAVLPFVSKSLDGESGFFASGVHDDLLTQLAQLQSIRVISRTSVEEYRDTVVNIREIGRELGADAILEGGVKQAGDQIRINAQLIDARTDEHLWAETFDRKLSPANIFQVQAEIARAITSALRTRMTAQDSGLLAVIPTENMAAYRVYHRAMADDNRTWGMDFRAAMEEAVALDPTFTRAWAELAGWLSRANYFGEYDPALAERTEDVLEKIRAVAPGSADHLMAQAYYTYYTLKDYDRAHQLITQAIEMKPSDVDLLELKSWIQRRQGNHEARLETMRLIHSLDPRNPLMLGLLIRDLMLNHRYDEARDELDNSTLQNFQLSYYSNLLSLRVHRDFDRWVQDLVEIEAEFGSDADLDTMWEVHIMAGNYPVAEKILGKLSDPGENDTVPFLRGLSAFETAQIITAWFLQDKDQLSDFLVKARNLIDKSRNPDGSFDSHTLYLDLALINAVEGNTQETEKQVRRWFRKAAQEDQAVLAWGRDWACQILGMAGATAAAVDCIRTGVVVPSKVVPFFEPHLSYYDSIRDEPEFVELLSELNDTAK